MKNPWNPKVNWYSKQLTGPRAHPLQAAIKYWCAGIGSTSIAIGATPAYKLQHSTGTRANRALLSPRGRPRHDDNPLIVWPQHR